MSADPQDAKRSIESLRHEINRLIREQLDAYQSATFLGATSPEAEKCDARRRLIRKLVAELWQQRAAINNFNV
jgi:50S ribosomal subunit-associated GTPase HflX